MKRTIPYRIFETIPGLFVWITLIASIIFSIAKPIWAIYFIIIFDIYWLLRILYLMIYMLSSWSKYRKVIKIDWMAKLKESKIECNNYWHLVFLPVYNEAFEIIDATFECLKQNDYPKNQFIIVLTGEERAGGEKFLKIAQKIKEKYSSSFNNIFINIHPKDLPDEMPGKGSNIHHAGKEVKKLIDQMGLDYSKIIVSSFDIDTRPHKHYFSYLTYVYATHPNPTRASFQPIAIYNNNVWQSNPIVRVVASSTTFWLFTDLARPERLYTFSSHSMSFQALSDVGFWDKSIVTEDSKIFLQCFYHYDGDYKVVPLYIPVYMNTVEVGKLMTSLKNQYKQMRRWAWGIEHFPWMMTRFFGEKNKIPLRKKIHYIWNLFEGTYSWATAPLIIFIVGHVPLWVASYQGTTSSIFQNAPYTLSYLMRFSMAGIVAIAVMYAIMLPPRPKNMKQYHYIIMVLQWVLSPFTLIFFGSIPATDAQTRLMLGGKFRLGFWATEKKEFK